MNKYNAVNNANVNDVVNFKAETLTDARHWVINHLDCSKEWTLYLDEENVQLNNKR